MGPVTGGFRKGRVMWCFDVVFADNLNMLNKESICRWFQKPLEYTHNHLNFRFEKYLLIIVGGPLSRTNTPKS